MTRPRSRGSTVEGQLARLRGAAYKYNWPDAVCDLQQIYHELLHWLLLLDNDACRVALVDLARTFLSIVTAVASGSKGLRPDTSAVTPTDVRRYTLAVLRVVTLNLAKSLLPPDDFRGGPDEPPIPVVDGRPAVPLVPNAEYAAELIDNLIREQIDELPDGPLTESLDNLGLLTEPAGSCSDVNE